MSLLEEAAAIPNRELCRRVVTDVVKNIMVYGFGAAIIYAIAPGLRFIALIGFVVFAGFTIFDVFQAILAIVGVPFGLVLAIRGGSEALRDELFLTAAGFARLVELAFFATIVWLLYHRLWG